MKLTNDEIVTILLTSYVALTDKTYKPFTIREWNQFVIELIHSSIKEPGNLLELNKEQIKNKLNLSNEASERIDYLLGRGILFALELEQLSKKGIGVLVRNNTLYPKQIKAKLKKMAPPVLFYCGNLELTNQKGIAIVGSRNVDDTMVNHTINIVKAAIEQEYIIYSGGAKGVDTISENEAFKQQGKYVSFIADSLESRIKKKNIREHLASNRILLLTATKPDVGFSVANAMNRNKYIYALSECAFIINADYNKGGTWAGAVENLKAGWTKSIVIENNSIGNKELINKGIQPLKETSSINIEEIIRIHQEMKQLNIFSALA